MSKAKKKDLRKDTVVSDTLHVGIELELRAPGSGESSHDDDACRNSAYDSQQEFLNDMSNRSILIEYFGLSSRQASSVESYFNDEQWCEDAMSNWEWNGCDNESDCCFSNEESHESREEIALTLKNLTDNASIKVVDDSSVHCESNTFAAEVCWNYFISKETIKDNDKILKKLKELDCDFDESCGLHINLNNYLKLDSNLTIATESLSFLFNFVAKSRAKSSYCNKHALSGNQKYSMIYNQGDRLEFRFFSPTLESTKLNHYVTLANVIYRRLCGKNAKLSKKATQYFLKKMVDVNGVNATDAAATIEKLNTFNIDDMAYTSTDESAE